MVLIGTNRIAIVDKDKCQPDKCQLECQRFCPPQRNGIDVVSIDGHSKINEETCIGCGICTKKCPFDAIMIINLSHELTNIIHQYGLNTFRLYGLPIVVENSIIGLLGPNGTGKTTSLQILSGLIKPNFGDFINDISWDIILKQFRGSELYKYMEKLKDGKIKSIYKIQRIDLLAKNYGNKKVSEVLKGVKKELLKDFELEGVLDKKVGEISGGELQKVSIVASLNKDVDFYFIDEPSSYLDIKQRINMTFAIKKHTSGKSVMVVEHDLATLDMISDYIHILYGTPGAYGVVSKKYSSRRAINLYLSGFIKEENVRFRDEALDFKSRGQVFEGKTVHFKYPAMNKNFPSFELKIDGGEIYQGEIIGIIGENALGKTTFMRLLNGNIKDDAGADIEKINISYKPQYLKEDYEGSVEEYLRKNIKLSTDTKMHLINPLGVDKLMEKEMNRLSGGELQRVMIVKTLGKDADLYLLDEPSAFLDVEERVRFVKVLRRFIENNKKACFVIDHDLMLMNYISDRVIVFKGISGVKGNALKPMDLQSSMNVFLKEIGVTFRKDPDTGRPRANKIDSQKDKEQKKRGVYFEVM